MHKEEFETVFEAQVERCRNILLNKAQEYATDVDRLRNFKVAAAVSGIKPRQALAGMLAKHIVSIFDICWTEYETPDAIWDEKLTDALNYLILLKAIQVEGGKDA